MIETIWESTLDGKYLISVVRLSSMKGRLEIHDDSNLLFSEEVWLSYGAAFGPDVEDVDEWRTKAVNFIDSGKAA